MRREGVERPELVLVLKQEFGNCPGGHHAGFEPEEDKTERPRSKSRSSFQQGHGKVIEKTLAVGIFSRRCRPVLGIVPFGGLLLAAL